MDFFASSLLDWYATHKRDLPWRDCADAYRIWVSEIILQQTRVDQGYDYYNRFIRRFPTLSALANATEEEVLKYWQGLGYYSRARNMYAAAKAMRGVFPTTYEGVMALKGVGRYTAAAICSFAYNLPYAVVDGNVYRVLARYFNIEEPIDGAKGKKLFDALAGELLPRQCASIYNQAIMDFGALCCTPKLPHCYECPLAEQCASLGAGTVERRPVKTRYTRVSVRYFNYIYPKAGEYTFIRQRTGNDIWQNLYEMPLLETNREVSISELMTMPGFIALFGDTGISSVNRVCRNFRHVLTHRVILTNCIQITIPPETEINGYIKIRASQRGNYAVSRLMEQLYQMISE